MKDQLLLIAKQILEINPSALLSGSLALHLQGIKTRNEPSDIDIYMQENHIRFIAPEGITESYDHNTDDYRNEEYIRVHFRNAEGIKIDVFYPMPDFKHPLVGVHCMERCVRYDDIIKFKIMSAFDEHSSAEKHQQDIIYMMNHNADVVYFRSL